MSYQSISCYLLFSAFLALSACKEDPNFKFVKLADYKYRPVKLAEGTVLKLIAYSGGKICTSDATYYYQFIGIEETTHDTIRILAACVEYDEKARLLTATYSPTGLDSTMALIGRMDEKPPVPRFSENKFVVINKKHPIEMGDFKTAIGSLSFK